HSHALGSSVVLAANTTYYIAADLVIGQSYYSRATGLSTIGGISYVKGVIGLGTGGKPTSDPFNGGSQDPAYYGPNFEVPGAPAPEPSTLVPGGLAVVFGLGCAWRRRKAAGAAA